MRSGAPSSEEGRWQASDFLLARRQHWLLLRDGSRGALTGDQVRHNHVLPAEREV